MTADQFLNNSDDIRTSLIFSGSRLAHPVCAYIYLANNQEVNIEMLKLSREILKDDNGVFSPFRSHLELVFACMLAVDQDPGTKMLVVNAAYDALKDYFSPSSYLSLLAFFMSDRVKPENFYEVASRARQMHDGMNQQHRFLTDAEDITYAGLLALHREDIYQTLAELEEMYQFLEPVFGIFEKDSVQALTHGLALCAGEPMQKCDNFLEIYQILRQEKINWRASYDLVSLAILANVGIDIPTVAQDILDVYDYLEGTSQYGIFGFSKQYRIAHATMIVSAYYMAGNAELLCAVTISALKAIIAAQSASASAASV